MPEKPPSTQPPALNSGWTRETTPYHLGEKMLQGRAGTSDLAERVGRMVIRDSMLDQHRELFCSLPFVLLGSLDTDMRPWASIVIGRPGFITSPTPTLLRLRTSCTQGSLAWKPTFGAPVGILGIQLETRRRNRMNGKVVQIDEDGFTVRVDQSFGNCPKYIQAREPSFRVDPSLCVNPDRTREGPELSTAACDLVRRADTFFVATSSPAAGGVDPVEGVDVNHRGGKPGFVRVSSEESSTVLTSPDFVGNFAFSTFGNIALNPRAGLLFVDFETGSILSLTGSARVDWEPPADASFPGADRFLRFVVQEGEWIANSNPLRWSAPRSSPQVNATASWRNADQGA